MPKGGPFRGVRRSIVATHTRRLRHTFRANAAGGHTNWGFKATIRMTLGSKVTGAGEALGSEEVGGGGPGRVDGAVDVADPVGVADDGDRQASSLEFLGQGG